MRLFLVLSLMLTVVSCGPRVFQKGEYDDVKANNNLNDKWSETDMQKAVEDLVGKMTKHRSITSSKTPPIVMVTQLQNKTSEHIDTQSIMDMVKVELMNTGAVQFVDKEARDDVKAEYDYQNSGMVAKETAKGAGGQIGADFIINGRLDSIVQEVGNDKTVYYKITLNLTNLKTNLIVWAGYKELRKQFEKRRVGL